MEWDNFGLWDLKMKNDEDVERTYSMASYPARKRNHHVKRTYSSSPPWDRNKNTWMDVPPGIASSYISKKPGDTVTISNMETFLPKKLMNEMLYVGGGAGMAPMRSHLYPYLEL